MQSAQGDQHVDKKKGGVVEAISVQSLHDCLGDNPEEWLENPVYDITGVVAEGWLRCLLAVIKVHQQAAWQHRVHASVKQEVVHILQIVKII